MFVLLIWDLVPIIPIPVTYGLDMKSESIMLDALMNIFNTYKTKLTLVMAIS